MRVWTDSIGLVARGSNALPHEQTTQLRAYAFDLRGVTHDLAKPARAWQRFDADEQRHETFQFPAVGQGDLLVSPTDVPEAYLSARAVHLLVGTIEPHFALLEHLHTNNMDPLVFGAAERDARLRHACQLLT